MSNIYDDFDCEISIEEKESDFLTALNTFLFNGTESELDDIEE